MKVGESIITTTVDSDGTATNNITGDGQVLINPESSRPEQHDLSEVLSVLPSGGLQGIGSGHISVSNLFLGIGGKGAVTDYHSVWTM